MSYQPKTFAIVPLAIVISLSKMHECGFRSMSDETMQDLSRHLDRLGVPHGFIPSDARDRFFLGGDPNVSYRESLALFGYPISGKMQERLEDGNVYTVQYFERARFEYHLESIQNDFGVQLGQFDGGEAHLVGQGLAVDEGRVERGGEQRAAAVLLGRERRDAAVLGCALILVGLVQYRSTEPSGEIHWVILGMVVLAGSGIVHWWLLRIER